ncbi:MAG: hypothetical protein ACQXXJ_03095 [Candidatus Bathyarchaeia archaeon]|jgi:hypothetical protein
MTRGKHWSPQEENELRTLIENNVPLTEIAAKFRKTPDAILIKCRRMGMKIQADGTIDTSTPLPEELPSVEEVLKMLADALKTGSQPGLPKAEIQRIQAVATIAKTYKELLADYINYRGIEAKLKEMEELNAKLLKEERGAGTPPPPDPAPVAQPPTQ